MTLPMKKVLFFIVLLAIISPLLQCTQGLPLSTRSRWIVDEKSGQRVKLACVNWVAHADTALPEGLDQQPVDIISKQVKDMGFNCVRLTYPMDLVTNSSLSSLTVRQSFTNVGILNTLPALLAHNPYFVDLTLVDAFKAVVKSLGNNGVMVILDNHLTKPGWCCSTYDGEGFFGDVNFNPTVWVRGLYTMAALFRNETHVVGMSLRNEPRGPRQNLFDWYRYMQQGAEAIHMANPDVLVILGGITYDSDLSYIRYRPVQLSFSNKLVYEYHWYSFTKGQKWTTGNANEICGKVKEDVMASAGYLLYQGQGYPLFLSEFGIDLVQLNEDDRRYMDCFLAWAAEHDLEWALWALQGSYYKRTGEVGMKEYFGVLDSTWSNPKSLHYLQQLSLIQSPLKGPGLGTSRRYSIIFHPTTGLCVLRNPSAAGSLRLGPCKQAERWTYNRRGTITLKDTSTALEAYGLNQPARVSYLRSQPAGVRWIPISDSRLHLAALLGDNRQVCLDVDSNSNVITTSCKCLSGDAKCDPTSQWFKIVNVGR